MEKVQDATNTSTLQSMKIKQRPHLFDTYECNPLES